jgi:menaquinone-dependent protoporphyrinogen oxidase
MHVLVTYGSKMGGTAGIAELVGQALTDAGFQADVRPISEVDRLEAYDAVLVGGALYSGRWHREARRGSSSATPAHCARGRCGCSAAGR